MRPPPSFSLFVGHPVPSALIQCITEVPLSYPQSFRLVGDRPDHTNIRVPPLKHLRHLSDKSSLFSPVRISSFALSPRAMGIYSGLQNDT